MLSFHLPDVMMARAAKRLRALADAIDAGEHLTDIAAKFRIPIRALRRVAAPRPRKPPKHKRPAITQIALARAAKRIRGGVVTYREVAIELNVKVSSLIKALTKHNVTKRALRQSKIEQAVDLYRPGFKISEICEQTGIPTMTLYARLRQVDGVARRPRTGQSKALDPKMEGELQYAAGLYRQGLRLKDITAQTGIATAALYDYLEKTGGYMPRRRARSHSQGGSGGGREGTRGQGDQ